MKVVFKSYPIQESISVYDIVKNKKLCKYFSRETEAAMMCMHELLNESPIDPLTPFYYSYCMVEYENYGLSEVAKLSLDESHQFTHKNFVHKGMSSISPSTQFKILYNMTLSFVCIEHNLKGENAVVYSSADGLIQQLKYCPLVNLPILLGAGRVYEDGKVESGFALLDNISDILSLPKTNQESIDLFRDWSKQK